MYLHTEEQIAGAFEKASKDIEEKRCDHMTRKRVEGACETASQKLNWTSCDRIPAEKKKLKEHESEFNEMCSHAKKYIVETS